jgi:hypothetical protein
MGCITLDKDFKMYYVLAIQLCLEVQPLNFQCSNVPEYSRDDPPNVP